MAKIDLSKYRSEVLFEENDFLIVRFNELPKETLSFLKEINWGAEGAVYQNMDTESVFNMIPVPHLIAILEKDKIVATGVFCHTLIGLSDQKYPCYYIRFFAASKDIQGKGIMKNYTSRIMELITTGVTEKTIFFANVERGNKASYRVVNKSGYEPTYVVKTNGFSRFFPKLKSGVSKVIKKEEKENIKNLLSTQYGNHALVQFDTLFQKENYHVIRHNGEIVAGCQFFRVHWVIKKMPGISGKLLMNALPKIPILRRLFNPNKFVFLAFDAIFLKPGHEKDLQNLFEHLLASEKLSSGIFWMGETCAIRKSIISNMSLGLLHGFVEKSDIHCMVHASGFSGEEIKEFSQLPVYAPAFDYI
jgi:hypothetical protein